MGLQVLHRDVKTFKDWIAYKLVKLARGTYDLVTGYRHKEIPPGSNMTVKELRDGGYILNEHQWLNV